jgi:prepilin-type processing-associated H-X9-DG protein
MWSPLLAPSHLALVSGAGRQLRGFFQELTHFAVHSRQGNVLWCDGDHGFDPYDFAELNLQGGHAADEGAQRVLVKRCMTPFQWDSVLTRHLDDKLREAPAALVVVNPFDRLWSTDELSDWEQEDYTRFSVRHLKETARREKVPILLGVDMERWWRTNPILAKETHEGVDDRWSVAWQEGRWVARKEKEVVDPGIGATSLADFMPQEEAIELAVHALRRAKPKGPPERRVPFRRPEYPAQ